MPKNLHENPKSIRIFVDYSVVFDEVFLSKKPLFRSKSHRFDSSHLWKWVLSHHITNLPELWLLAITAF
jgi:hypothetical protein